MADGDRKWKWAELSLSFERDPKCELDALPQVVYTDLQVTKTTAAAVTAFRQSLLDHQRATGGLNLGIITQVFTSPDRPLQFNLTQIFPSSAAKDAYDKSPLAADFSAHAESDAETLNVVHYRECMGHRNPELATMVGTLVMHVQCNLNTAADILPFLAATEEGGNAATTEEVHESVQYTAMQEVGNPTRFKLVEIFRDEQGPPLHKHTPWYQKWRDHANASMGIRVVDYYTLLVPL